MINQVILVGRLTYDPEIRELEDGRKVGDIVLAVQRPFKNAETGLFETDFIRCTLWQGIAENVNEYCKKGAVVGVKARIGIKKYTIDDEKSFTYPEIIAEKVTFIHQKRES